MIIQIIAKTKWFLRDASPLLSLVIFVTIAITVWALLFYVRKRQCAKSILYAVLFSASLTLIIMFTLLRKPGVADSGFDHVFDSLFSAFIVGSESYVVFLLNILLFIPFSSILRLKTSSIETATACCVLSLAIEITQMVFNLGIFEFSDWLGNSIGGILGILLYAVIKYVSTVVSMFYIFRKNRRRINRKEEERNYESLQ